MPLETITVSVLTMLTAIATATIMDSILLGPLVQFFRRTKKYMSGTSSRIDSLGMSKLCFVLVTLSTTLS